MMRFRRRILAAAAAVTTGAALVPAQAQLVINDTLTGASTSYDWKPLGGACLTAGDNTGTIKACSGLPYYTNLGSTLVGGVTGRLPDPVGQGALRLTNGDYRAGSNGNYETGAVVSNFSFPTNQGVQVTWTSVTYGGNAFNGTGADGMTFFLSDAQYPATSGGSGGALGYSCSNGNPTYDGVEGGYLGIGIDEFGNFSNPGDNTDTGPGFGANRISVRGAGSTMYAWLSSSASTFARYYPSTASASTKLAAVHNTCATGYAWNYSGTTLRDSTNTKIYNGQQTNDALPYNYPLLSYSDLPIALANQQAVNLPLRSKAVPITYSLTITPAGKLSFQYAVNGGTAQTVISNQDITASNGPLPANFRFGFSAGTGGGSNVHEITCFKAAQANQSSNSAGSNVQSGRADTTSQIYLSYYHSSNWWGSLTANSLVFDPNTNGGTLSVSTTANWDANCGLTGGACQATGASTGTAQSPTNRVILSSIVGTGNASTGIAFEWASLNAAQKAALTAGDGASTANRLNYLRGDRTLEIANGGGFRTRTGVLGDIVDSSPTWVGPPTSPYGGPWADKLYPGSGAAEGTSYNGFASSNAGRTNVVYVGADDGLLHGFRAGTVDSSGHLGGTNDGYELLAYMPSQVLNTLHSTSSTSLDFSHPAYSHNFYVDATPGTGDLYYGGAWHTWLIGGLGPGGHAAGPVGDNSTVPAAPVGTVYALDITNPASFQEGHAASLVLGEWNSSSISCVNASTCGTHLGQTFGTPVVRRLHDGNWAVLFGNGFNSSAGTAGLFIMTVNAVTGARSFRYLDTGSGGASGARNGIAYVTAADLDGDHITDYVYAGDLNGNIWRFDLTSSNPSMWSVGSSPLFTTPSGQPITTRVMVNAINTASATGLPKVLVSFGTGQKQPMTQTSAETFASGTQALYGIWDWNMAAWNATATGTRYDSLVGPRSFSASNLQSQSVIATLAGSGSVSGYRTVTVKTVCWQGSSACSSNNNQFGWRLSLPGTQEQVIYSPTTSLGMFIVNTTIPGSTSALSCSTTPASGYTMAIQLTNGGAASTLPFLQDASGQYNTPGLAGVGLNGAGTPSIIGYPDPTTGVTSAYLVTQKTDGTAAATRLNPGGSTGARVNWTQAR